MSDKIIYLIPEPGVEGFKQGYEDHSIDVPFRISKPFLIRGFYSGRTYQLPLGCRTYAPPESGGILLMPRSKASLLWPKEQLKQQPMNRRNPVDYRVIDVVDAPEELTAYESCNLRLTNTIGYIDYSYRGEWLARFEVTGEVNIEPGKPLLQAVPLNTEYTFKVVESIDDVPEELRDTKRAEGGFGSTDVEHSEQVPSTESESEATD